MERERGGGGYLRFCVLGYGGKEGARRQLRKGPNKCHILLYIKVQN